MRLPRRILIIALIPAVLGHTWVEELRVINPNGTFASLVGYPRGNILRTSPAFDDKQLVHLLPPNDHRDPVVIKSSDPMCRPEQSKGNQTSGSPALSASPGDMIAMRYQENGHVSLPNLAKAENRGTVYIYGTTQPRADERFLDVHNVWTADGTGGDKRGVLLATRNYDDGQCYQINNNTISQERQKAFAHQETQPMGANLWCQTDITLPASLKPEGLYTIYWVWDWHTLPTADLPKGKPETYTSCMDIILIPGEGTSKKGVNYIKGQDLNEAAIEVQLTQQFLASPNSTVGIQAVSSNTIATATVNPDVDTVTVTVTLPPVTTLKTVFVTASPPDSVPTSSSTTAALSIRPFLTSTSATTAAAKGPKTVTTVVEQTVVITQTSTVLTGGAYTVMPRMRGRARM